MTSATKPSLLRIGIVSFTNALPLSHYLPEILPQARYIREVPSRLGKMLAKGELDVAILSSIELLNHPEYSYVPGLGICSDGYVRSVRLYSKTEVEKISSVALDKSSLSSVTLTRILMREHWRLSPCYCSFQPPLANGLALAEAAVTIGDTTLAEKTPTPFRYDLGQVWKDWCGLPFVYALWITRPGIDPVALIEPFSQAKKLGLQNLDRIIDLCTQMVSRPAPFFRDYYTDNVYYNVTEREQAGLSRFFAEARKILQRSSISVG